MENPISQARGGGVPDFSQTLNQHVRYLKRAATQVLQVNMGLLCNQGCPRCQ